jgi:LysM repeat protein
VKLSKTLSAPPPEHHRSSAPPSPPPDTTSQGGGDKTGFEYVVQQGDTLGKIVKGCREKNVMVTTDQILKANPGLVPEKLRVGQKIFIPGPQS